MTTRISVSSLLNFIDINSKKIKNINYVDLNLIKNDEINELKKLRFQEVKPITSLPQNLSFIFDIKKNKYLHSGVLSSISLFNNTDISIYSSLIVCLKPNFSSQNINYQKQFITTLIECLSSDSTKTSYRKYGWNRSDLQKNISGGFIGINILKFLCDYFTVNIFVLDIKSDSLYYAGGETYVPYKKNIFLIHHDNESFEPFYTEAKRFFNYNDSIIKKIREEKIVKVYQLSRELNFSFNEQEEELEKHLGIKLEKEEEKGEKEEKEEKEGKIVKIDDIINIIDKVSKSDYTKQELKNMKIADLQGIAKENNIDIICGKKKKTKDILIENILDIKKN